MYQWIKSANYVIWSKAYEKEFLTFASAIARVRNGLARCDSKTASAARPLPVWLGVGGTPRTIDSCVTD
jgi:hypothetical protein